MKNYRTAFSTNSWRLVTQVGTTMNLPRLQRVMSITFSWVGFPSGRTGL